MFLVTGTPRSGTHYTSAVLKEIGLKVRHEELDEDGTVSWKHIGSGFFNVAERKRTTEISDPGFTHVIHQVRHPLKSISSMQTLRACSWDFMARHVKIDLKASLPIKSMQAWVGWNGLIEERAQWRFRIEDIPDVFGELLERLGQKPCPLPNLDRQTRESRSDRYPSLTWENLLHTDSDLATGVASLAVRYGYDVPDLASLSPTAPPVALANTRALRVFRSLFGK